ncbi:glycine cleavage system aminomethyltransferase GcvT [Candidatus Bathyarchaeota archaeon]|nr:glycine cleavage system aminomethyltransferase GcvT [Candidatus Bathyarchaeota archaeon]
MGLKRSHLYEYHKEHGKIVEFAGFEMPVWFEGIIPEHNAVRNSVGLFDVSHMGRTIAEGKDVEKYVNYIITNDVSALEPMSGLYTVMCNSKGGIVDDLTLYKLDNERVLIVYNASNREKDFNWFKNLLEGFDISISDVSDDIAMIAIQGPKAEKTLQEIATANLKDLPRFKIAESKILGYDSLIARTGYTGEDGFEVFILDTPLKNPIKAIEVWNMLLDVGAEYGIKACGLGARDSLRLEAGLSLYGNDIDEEINPFEAKLRWVVKLKKASNFVGKDALLKISFEGVKKTRVGITLEERGIPRHGYEIWDQGKIGVITSGGYSPTLDRGIALGYVPLEYDKIGTPVKIKIRDKFVKGKICKSHPFYDESEYGWKREMK